MRALTYFVATSLDGRIAGPADEIDAFPLEGDPFDAIFGDWRDTLPGFVLDKLGLEADGSVFDTCLMGWGTYAPGLAQGVADPYPHLRQYVASRRPRDLPAGIELTTDPVATVRALKAEPSDRGIWLCGGGALAAALADEVDRLVLKVNPIVLADGPPVFAGGYDPRAFALERSTPYASGVLINEYARRD